MSKGRWERIGGAVQLFAKSDNNALPRIEGYACKFNTYSALMWDEFYTVIDPNFFAGVFAQAEIDVICNLEHEDEDILARFYPSKNVKTLDLSIDQTGLFFGYDTPNTTRAKDAAEDVRVGNILGCSMAVMVAEDDWRQTYNGKPVRRLMQCSDLMDVCLTVDPWFPDTEVNAKFSRNGMPYMKREDYLSMAKSARPEKAVPPDSMPDDYFHNVLKLIELDR